MSTLIPLTVTTDLTRDLLGTVVLAIRVPALGNAVALADVGEGGEVYVRTPDLSGDNILPFLAAISLWAARRNLTLCRQRPPERYGELLDNLLAAEVARYEHALREGGYALPALNAQQRHAVEQRWARLRIGYGDAGAGDNALYAAACQEESVAYLCWRDVAEIERRDAADRQRADLEAVRRAARLDDSNRGEPSHADHDC